MSADSRQVYRGLDIGTAKASADQRAAVVHHGLDLVDPPEPFSVADFRRHALAALRGLAARNGVGILAGGTGFWIRAVAQGLDTEGLPSDRDVRATLEQRLTQEGLDVLVTELGRIAPRLAAGVDVRNPRRVVRALEIATIAGDVSRPPSLGYRAPVLTFLLDVEPTVHRDRLARRARHQFDAGLVDEARLLRDRWGDGWPAFSAIGYREAWRVLDGSWTIDEAIETDARRNVQFAKRQRTWFRRESGVRIDATGDARGRVVSGALDWIEQAQEGNLADRTVTTPTNR